MWMWSLIIITALVAGFAIYSNAVRSFSRMSAVDLGSLAAFLAGLLVFLSITYLGSGGYAVSIVFLISIIAVRIKAEMVQRADANNGGE